MAGDYLTELEEVSSMAGSDTETLQRHRNAAQLRRPRSRRWGTEAVPLKCLLRYPLSDLIENRIENVRHFLRFRECPARKEGRWSTDERERERQRVRKERESTERRRGVERRWRGWGSERKRSDPFLLLLLLLLLLRPLRWGTELFGCLSLKAVQLSGKRKRDE